MFILTLIEHWFSLAFAGIWGYIFHWGVGIGAIVVLLIAAYATQLINAIPVIGPPLADFLRPLRHDLIWAAGAVALLLVGQYIGAHDATQRCVAKQVVIEKIVNKAVDKTKTPAAKGKKDPYDDPDS